MKRVSERIMLIRTSMGKRIMCLMSVYAPQAVRAMVDKEEFNEALEEVLKGVKEEEALFICGYFNGHGGGRRTDTKEFMAVMVSEEETWRVSYCWNFRRPEIWQWQTSGLRRRRSRW